MKFKLLPSGSSPFVIKGENCVFLIKDDWNDWWSYKTLFQVYISKDAGVEWLGSIKIGVQNETRDENNYVIIGIPDEFEVLSEEFFSAGQDVSYYSNLYALNEDIRFQILRSLNDLALDEDLYERVKTKNIVSNSLLRDVTSTSLKGQYRRLANGNAILTPYNFLYSLPNNEMDSKAEFIVKPKSFPPSNLHVVIGRNGVGKTHLLKNVTELLKTHSEIYGSLEYDILDNQKEDLFANLITVSFSTFDQQPVNNANNSNIPFKYIGSQKIDGKQIRPKSFDELTEEFLFSLEIIAKSARAKRWKRAIKTLSTDPIFSQLGIEYLITPDFKDKGKIIFEKLSSGHKIVLLTITKLVETVEERTLVILDEPETHLHPPLLSAFTRALSELMIYRNAVAIVATHSPVILQEVPKSCVWIMNRITNTSLTTFERPEVETFGENIGTLTREVFSLEVTHSGFHTLLKQAVEEYSTYDDILNYFNGQLGMEGRTILKSLLYKREREEG